jgi:3-hydroxyacyl-[acyl-carrier-protein] dehydratase
MRVPVTPAVTSAPDRTSVTSPCCLPPSDTTEILKHIPHRYPFLLIDRMEACEPNQWVRVIKNVSHNDEFFLGTPLARRVMPQMLLVEAIAQAAGVLCHYSGMKSRIGKTIFFFAGFDKCRFGRDVVPGDRLLLECAMKRAARGVAKIHGRATVDGKMVLESDLTAVIRDLEEEATKRTAASAAG